MNLNSGKSTILLFFSKNGCAVLINKSATKDSHDFPNCQCITLHKLNGNPTMFIKPFQKLRVLVSTPSAERLLSANILPSLSETTSLFSAVPYLFYGYEGITGKGRSLFIFKDKPINNFSHQKVSWRALNRWL